MLDSEYWEFQNEKARWKIYSGAIGMFLAGYFLVSQWFEIQLPQFMDAFSSPVAEAATQQVTSGDYLSILLIVLTIALWSSTTLHEGLTIRRYYKKHFGTTEKEPAPVGA